MVRKPTTPPQIHVLAGVNGAGKSSIIGATIRDKGGMIVARLGHMYSAKGCAMVVKQALHSIESKPGSFWVWVATKGHPGDLRGKLFAGMAHM